MQKIVPSLIFMYSFFKESSSYMNLLTTRSDELFSDRNVADLCEWEEIENNSSQGLKRQTQTGVDVSHPAVHHILPQAVLPLLQERTGSAPVSIQPGEFVLQLCRFRSSQVHRQHDGLVVGERFHHLLSE